ncbi:MAG: aldehyde dehydrogenase family protein [Candidatus Neomarinimicrobiota bacterium]
MTNYTDCYNPATGEKIGQVPLTSPEELQQIFTEARAVQKDWAALPVRERAKYIFKVRDYLVDYADEIATLISQDNGKVKLDALVGEVFAAALAANYYAKNAQRFLKDEKLKAGSLLLFYKRSRIVHVPYGVVGIISPWNYPFGIPIHEIVFGLLAGNAIVLKTASETLLVGQKLAEIFYQSGLPQGIFNFVNIPGREVGSAFLDNGINKIFFTGSEAVGKILSRQAADTLTPLSLELGGNDPMLVCPDADIHRAAGGAIWAGFTNSGQNCGAVERIYVHEEVYQQFCELMKDKVARFRIGSGADYANDMGVMTTTGQIRIVQEHLEDALAKGARILVRTEQVDTGLKNVLPAVVLVDVNHEMRVMREETFGPVLAIMKVADMDEAVRLANDSDLGLTGSVWSENRATAETLARRLEVGAVLINDHLMSHGLAETPWGGFKRSGNGGRTHGRWGFEEMTQPQVIVQDYFPFARQSMWWHPYTKGVYRAFLHLPKLLFGNSIKKRFQGLWALIRVLPRYYKT